MKLVFFFKTKAIEVDHVFHLKMIYWNKVILIDTQRHHTGCFTWSHCGAGSALGGVPVCTGREPQHQSPVLRLTLPSQGDHADVF